MGFSYNRLWKLLIDKHMNKTDLRKALNINPRTMSKMSRNENVNMKTLGKICEFFDCNIGDIVDFLKE